MQDQKRFFTVFIVILSFFVVIFGGYYAYGAYKDMNKGLRPQVDKRDQYPLRKNATELQKEIHEKLISATKEKPMDKKLVASLVSQSFVADYFTWTNKLQFNDVGGLYYVHEGSRKSVYDKSLDTFYHDLQLYLKEATIEDSLEVSKINTKTQEVTIEMDEKQQQAYLVETSWAYKESNLLNLEEYQTKTFVKVLEDKTGHFSVVEVNGNEEED